MTQLLSDNTSFRITCSGCANTTYILWENLKDKDHFHCPACTAVIAVAHLPIDREDFGNSYLVVDFSHLDLGEFMGDPKMLGTIEIEPVD